MEQLSRKLKYWEYNNERHWRELKEDTREWSYAVYEQFIENAKFWSGLILFLKLKVLKNVFRLSQHLVSVFFACVGTQALRLQHQPGETISSEDLYRQLNESVNYNQFLRR